MPTGNRLKFYLPLALFIILTALAVSACIPAAPVSTPAETPTAAAAATNPVTTTTSTTTTATTTTTASAPQAAAATGQGGVYALPDLKGRSVVAVAANDFTPFDYVDPQTGKNVGMEYDIVNEICRRLNCTVDWKAAAWDGMIAAIHAGQFDVGMDGITITDERKQQVDFSVPYKTLQNYMLVRKDETRFKTPKEFAANDKLLIGSQAGTTQFFAAVYDILDGNEKNPRIHLFDNFGAAVQALIAGDVDMVLASAESGKGYIGANPDKLQLVGDPLGNEDIGFIFTPKSDLVEPFNQAIGSMQRDGYLDYLNTRWFYLNDPNGKDVYDQLPDLKGRKVAAVTANDYTPLNFVDPKTGKAVGWEYDAVNEICKRLNCVVDWQTAAWDGMIAAISGGQFDVGMDGITINDERKQQVDFTMPYMTSQQFMLVRVDESRFKTPQEFAADSKLLIGSQSGTTGYYTAINEVLKSKDGDPRVKLFDTFGSSVQALISGDVDMVLVDAASGRGYIGANPDKLQLVGDPLGNEDIGFIFTPKSDLVEPFNQAIGSMQRDGYLDYLNTRWFYLNDPNGKDVYDQLPDLKGRKVAAVTANDYTPLNFVDPKTGKAVGWEYDAVNEICKRLNCVVDWQTAAWDGMIAAISGGQFDVGMDGITINDERKQQVDFTMPYMTSQQFMLVRVDENRFKTPQEFAADSKLLIGSQSGTTGYYTAINEVLKSKEGDPRVKLFDTFGSSVQALIAGDVDMVLVDAASGRGYIGANPDKLKIVGDPLGTEDFGFILKKGSDLVAPFNAAIDSMKQDKYNDYLNTKWFFLYDPNQK